MTPSEIRDRALNQLRQAVLKMTSSEWGLSLEGQPKEMVRRARRELLRTQRARLSLENAQLQEIRDKLVANEKSLEKGRKALETSLQDLQKVRKVLDAVTGFLGVVARVISIPGG